jgi:hypothetical protein
MKSPVKSLPTSLYEREEKVPRYIKGVREISIRMTLYEPVSLKGWATGQGER